MNIQDFTGKPLPEFFRDRGFALFDAHFATLVWPLLFYLIRRCSRAKLLVGYSLRAKVMAIVLVLATACVGGFLLEINAIILLLFTFLTFALLVFSVLNDLSRVGITNAFETTRQGVSAAESLMLVKHEIVFLGIGAKKLTETVEFDAMLERCRAARGSLKFLLSSPDNQALEAMAKRNGRNDLTYRSRVKESIRDIFTRASNANVNFEIRLYNLEHEISLPHFRLVFIDGKLCIFSQLLWSAGEGLDNPQLVLRGNKNSAGSSLYQGYRDYFDDLWNLGSTLPVTQDVIDSWPV